MTPPMAGPAPGAAAPQVGPDGQPVDPLDPNAPPTGVDPSQLSGVETMYFALKTGGESGKAVGLIRVADDDDAEVLTLERFTPEGEWEDDPGLIDEIHAPGCYSVEEAEAQSIQAQIVQAQPSDPTQA